MHSTALIMIGYFELRRFYFCLIYKKKKQYFNIYLSTISKFNSFPSASACSKHSTLTVIRHSSCCYAYFDLRIRVYVLFIDPLWNTYRVASRCVAPANVANRQLCTELGARSSELRAAGSKHVACYSVFRAVRWITGFALITSKKSPPLHRFRMHNLSPLVQLWWNFELRIFWLIQAEIETEAQNWNLSIKMYLDCKRYEYDVCDTIYDIYALYSYQYWITVLV